MQKGGADMTIGEQFREIFPYYLALGMTEAEFWDGDCELVRYYRKAAEYKTQRMNEAAWLAGLYVYEAIADLVPVLNPMVKHGTHPTPYPERPYPITEGERKARDAERAEQEQEAIKAYMTAWMNRNNKKYESEVKPDG